MAILSDNIEQFIKSMIGEYEGMIELQRNELADYFSCAPSQINYVLATRFSPEKGYIIESRRGGGGYIKVIKITRDRSDDLMSAITVRLASGEISQRDAFIMIESLEANGHISAKEQSLMKAAVSDKALAIPLSVKDRIRASVLREMLTALLKEV